MNELEYPAIPPPTAEDVTDRINSIRTHRKVIFKSNIARRLHTSPKYLSDFMSGARIMPIGMFERLCKLELRALRKSKWENDQRENLSDIELAENTKKYLDKQIRMQQFRMGETILRNLADSPKTIAELRKIVKKHRQSVFRKIQDMEYYGIVECTRVRHHTLCRLKPGIQSYLMCNHWSK